MAHSRSAAKRYRQSLHRQAANRTVRSAARTHVTKALSLIKAGPLPEAEAAVREAASVLDRAEKKGVIKANNAARRKSRLMARYNAATASAAAAAVAQAEAQAKAEAEPPPPEKPVEARRRIRLGRKPAEKTPAKAAKPAAAKPEAAKGRAKTSTAKKDAKTKAKKK